MPREGENLLGGLVRAIEDRSGFAFGDPWLPDGGSTLVLPILRSKVRSRGYVLAEEAAEDVRAIDPGRLDRLRLTNESSSRVLLRCGLLFQGRGTPSRGTASASVLEPRETTDVEVRCVHPTQPLTPGAPLHLAREATPEAVWRALLSGDQGAVWEAVDRFVSASGETEDARAAEHAEPPPSDDLVAILADARDDAMDEVLRQTPSHPGQCGMLILDARGVVAVEFFDHPDSWRAAAPAILARHAPLLRPSPESPVRATAHAETAFRRAIDFLRSVAERRSRRATRDGWRMGDPPCEYVVLDGEVVYLAARRAADPRAESAGILRSAAPAPADAADPSLDFASAVAIGRPADADGAEVSVAAEATAPDEEPELPPMAVPRARRKVLTSGWDPATFQALERYAGKEFRGDRSAALRSLVRQGLRRRGYMGPLPIPARAPSFATVPTARAAPPDEEADHSAAETRIRDLERIAQTPRYAEWLRKRARLELERMAAGADDGFLRTSAQSALERMVPAPEIAPPPEAEPMEAPPSLTPDDVRRLLRGALVASAGGNYNQALALFDEILAGEPANLTALLGRAVACRKAGKIQEALADLDRVLRLDPKNAAALLNRGRILQEKGDLRGALDAFDGLVAVARDDWDAWMMRGDVLMRMGRDDEALAAYREALRRNPDDEKLRRRTHALEAALAAQGPSTPTRIALPQGMEEGQSYLVKERKPDRGYRLLKALADHKLPSLVVTRQHADQVRRERDLAGVRVVRLSHEPGADAYRPEALAQLSLVIERFVEANRGRGAILLDSMDFLVAENGFRDALLFVEHVNELILQRRAIFVLSVPPESLPERELALLERNLKTLS